LETPNELDAPSPCPASARSKAVYDFRYFRCALREAVDGARLSRINTCPEISDKFGHGNCVMLRDPANLTISRFAVNTLIAADFGGIRAMSRSTQSGFESR
jgi:hypothetical protein